jgi:hypothetical protein
LEDKGGVWIKTSFQQVAYYGRGSDAQRFAPGSSGNNGSALRCVSKYVALARPRPRLIHEILLFSIRHL